MSVFSQLPAETGVTTQDLEDLKTCLKCKVCTFLFTEPVALPCGRVVLQRVRPAEPEHQQELPALPRAVHAEIRVPCRPDRRHLHEADNTCLRVPQRIAGAIRKNCQS
ncbi:hypothetical protein DIPPA_03434 [Diplonema papillatum]|nr:hypothetical protein DIPPA_03434 [Diplonema papillatum]